MADPAYILLFHEAQATGEWLRARLAQEGFDVTLARTFLDAAKFLVAGRVNLFLIYLPETEWVRNAILTEVRRANPTLPILALTPAVSNELGQVLARFHVAEMLPAGGSWEGLLGAIHKALGSPEPAVGGPA